MVALREAAAAIGNHRRDHVLHTESVRDVRRPIASSDSFSAPVIFASAASAASSGSPVQSFQPPH
jgi:hypothetical protein